MQALFEYQRPILADPDPNVALIGTRQFGKTRIAAVAIINAGIENPGSDVAYVDLDIEHGGKVVWKEVEKLLEEYNVPARILDGALRFDNGSTGYIFSGAKAEIKKLQGLKFSLLIIDEVQEAVDLSGILTMVGPALMRYNGRLLLMGIPGRIRKVGYWWDITEGSLRDTFSQHRGSFRDNTALSEAAKERLFESEKKRLGEKSSEFYRHWLGIWPELNNALRVYHYDPEKNSYTGDAPTCPMHSLGLDPGGVRDSEAQVVIGFGGEDGVIWHVDEDVTAKGDGGSWDDSGDRVGPMNAKWKPVKRFYDWGSAHKDSLTLIYQKDQHIVMEGVPSKDPYGESKRINQLLETGRLRIRKGSKLESDLLYTMWSEESVANGGKPQYDGSYKQDAADGLRCAMWGVPGWLSEKVIKRQKTDQEQEAEAIREILKPKVTYGQEQPQARKASRFTSAYGPRRN